MIKVGFFLSPTLEWIGGINYFRNLFYAVSKVDDPNIQLIIFVPKKIEDSILDMLIPPEKSLKIIRTSLLQRYTPYWFVWKLIRKLLKYDLAVFPLCKLYAISIVSHSDSFKIPGVKIINWIPDFQHIHLPEMFGSSQGSAKNTLYQRVIAAADSVVVSSDEAAKDLMKFFPTEKQKVSVVNFAVSAPNFYWEIKDAYRNTMEEIYGIKGEYFYVPNQFWRHKNHRVLIDAICELKKRGINIQIVCSGYKEDFRNSEHYLDLKKYIITKGCFASFRVLGVIPYKHVFSLIRFSQAVINPSLFEGWSTSVEESKAVGKTLILSDIPVHREQMPDGIFFDPRNSCELADTICELILKVKPLNLKKDFTNIRKLNLENIEIFGNKYNEIVKSLYS